MNLLLRTEINYEFENNDYNDDDDGDDFDDENEEKSSVDSEEKIILSDKKLKMKTVLPEIGLKKSEDIGEFKSFQIIETISKSEDQFYNEDIKKEKVTLKMVNNFILQKTEPQRQKK